MNPNLKWKAFLILAVTLASLYGLVGRPATPTSWAAIKSNFGSNIKLGLDLRGGTHMILQVQVEEAISLETDRATDALTNQLRSEAINFDEVQRLETGRILVRNVVAEQQAAFRDMAQRFFSDWELAPAAGEVNSFVLTLRASRIAQIREDTLRQSVETIRRRVDELGLTEPVVTEHGRGEDEILVQLPGVDDPARVKDIIRAGGQLELRLMRDQGPWRSEAEALAALGGVLPPGTELLPGAAEADEQGRPQAGQSWYLVDRAPIVTGRDLRSTSVSPSSRSVGRHAVDFSLSREAAQRFGPFTEANVGRRLAIVLEDRVQSAPVINSRIDDQGQIEDFTREQALDLALVLRSGALPASIRYLEERTIGPSLGADSIRQGFQASVLSLLVVMAFMLFYYRMAGINAVVALVLNLLLLMAILAAAGAALTLPGIAGVILTVGMGVDSNVLVFERIREELRLGKAPGSAVNAGFDRAILTIIDTHVTTIVSCLFLFAFGTGPVQGFAVTLVIGLLANLFTAIFVSRTIFGWHLSRMPREAALSI